MCCTSATSSYLSSPARWTHQDTPSHTDLPASVLAAQRHSETFQNTASGQDVHPRIAALTPEALAQQVRRLHFAKHGVHCVALCCNIFQQNQRPLFDVCCLQLHSTLAASGLRAHMRLRSNDWSADSVCGEGVSCLAELDPPPWNSHNNMQRPVMNTSTLHIASTCLVA